MQFHEMNRFIIRISPRLRYAVANVCVVIAIFLASEATKCSAAIIELYGILNGFNGDNYQLINQKNAGNPVNPFDLRALDEPAVTVQDWDASDLHFRIKMNSAFALFAPGEDVVKQYRFKFKAKIQGGIDLWESQFDIQILDRNPMNDQVLFQGISVSHLVAPHPGENVPNKFALGNLLLKGDELGENPLFEKEGKWKKGHGKDTDVAAALIQAKRQPAGFNQFNNQFTDWDVQFKTAHVPEPGSFGIMVCIALGSTLKRRWKNNR